MKSLGSVAAWSTVLLVTITDLAGAGSTPSPRPVAAPASAAGATASALITISAPEAMLGERLFFETRFAQFFFARCNGNVNATLAEGDPVVNDVPVAVGTPLAGPFRGQSMNCRQCHLGDDFLQDKPLAGRTYCDFSRRSPIPQRDDGLVRTPRNSPLMINLGLPRAAPLLLHLDGEFATHEDLVVDTLVGRNFGWLPGETALAVAHVAQVIRDDEGVNPRYITYASGRGIPYRLVMLGTDPRVPRPLRIPERYRIDVGAASDAEVLQAVARLMHAYMSALRFGTTKTGRESLSPYDLFLIRNQLPREPRSAESDRAYAQRLLTLIRDQRDHLVWVTPEDGEFELHQQPFQFGASELHGLEVFFTQADASRQAHVGNCVACHTPPQFTDYRLHNNGVSQTEYDAVFGPGAFAALDVPGLAVRNAAFDTYLPPTAKHPRASGRFRSAPSADKPGYADLGVWNIFANPDLPKPQAALTRILCEPPGPASKRCTPATVLPSTLARFKTPSIRDLGQSNPYFHSGAMDTIEDVLRFYITTSDLARAGKLRNGSPELSGVHIDATDVAPLGAFLRALNEDYH